MLEFFKKAKTFFLPYLLFVFLGLMALVFLDDKGAIVLWINDNSQIVWDWLFSYITILGNGWTLGIAALLLLLYRYKWGLAAILAFGVQAGIVQGLKRFVFSEMLRPSQFFSELSNIHLVKGVEVWGYYSFPSGHSSAAFCLFCLLSLCIKKPGLQLLSFIFAFLVGFSRMYLFQHFFQDVWVGSMIGVVVAVTVYYLLLEKTPGFLKARNWWDRKGLLVR